MTIKVRVNGLSVVVETDHRGAEMEHQYVRHDVTLIGGMRSFNIYELEAKDSSFLHDAFDREFKKKTGNETGYFSIY
jgi:hypothetical protein